jgi:succinoglycan biosynthesis protein ExoM
MLRALLSSLGALRFTGQRPDVLVVIVDNDGSGEVPEVVEEMRGDLPFPVHCFVEPERNIARARNRGVAEAIGRGASWIAFVDDDETVPPEWLDRLLATRTRFDADLVGGAVHPRLDPRAPAWLRAGGYFGVPERPTGSPLTIAFTNNVLVRASLLACSPAPFDEEFGLSGGSDSLLFMGLHRSGARMVWDNEAAVEELVPFSRQRAGWVLQRAFRVGNVAFRCEQALGRRGRRATRLAKGAARLTGGVSLLLPASLAGRAGAMRALWNIAYGCGVLSAACGYRYLEYRDLHGE